MPLPPPPADLLAQIKSKQRSTEDGNTAAASASNDSPSLPSKRSVGGPPNNALLAAIQAKSNGDNNNKLAKPQTKPQTKAAAADPTEMIPSDQLFMYNPSNESFQLNLTSNFTEPKLLREEGSNNTIIVVPLAPCVYRMTDYTYTKKEPISLSRCINKLNVLRCLQRECDQLNLLLENRLSINNNNNNFGTIEEDELSKTRFMELLSNCGVYQKISELILQCCNDTEQKMIMEEGGGGGGGGSVGKKIHVPQVKVDGLLEFLQKIEELSPSLAVAREEIRNTQSVSFHPGKEDSIASLFSFSYIMKI
jgi:hypothetical protein